MVAAARIVKSWWRKHPVLGWGAIGVLAAALVVGAFVLPAGAATTWRLTPSGEYLANANWTWVPAGSQATAWDSNDGDTTRAYTATANSWQYMSIDDVSAAQNPGAINSVTVYYRVKKSAAGDSSTVRARIRVSGVTVATNALHAVTTDYNTLYSLTDTARAWTWADVNNLDVGIQMGTGTTGTISVTEMYVVVDYTPAVTSTITVTDGAVAVSNAFVARSQTVAADAFRLQRTAGANSYVWAFIVENAGTGAPASTVSAVDIYADANGNGIFDAATDTKLNTASGVFSGTTASVVLTTPLLVDATVRTYFVVYTISATATDGVTATARVSDMTSNAVTHAGLPAATGGTFTVDVNNPAAVITSPAINYQYTTASPGVISGTASDSVPGSLSSVGVSIQRSGDNLYWNGTSGVWGAAQVFNAATTSNGWANWSYSWVFNPLTQTGTPTYTIVARATDAVAHTGDSTSVTGVTINNGVAGTLTVTQGADAGRPTVKVFSARSTDKVVDELSLAAATGTMTLTQIVVRGLDTVAGNLTTDVTGVRLFRDNGGTVGQWDGTDTQLGTTQTFTGGLATFSGLSLAIPAGTTEKVWVVYTVGASAVDGDIVGSQVNVGDVTATGGTVTQAANIVSAGTPAGQTIQIDAVAPTADTSDPLNNAVLTGASKTISGTASDGTGSGVGSVQVQIARSTGGYWTGTDWTGTSATWLTVTGTASWTYVWTLDAGQNNGPATYTITARATDNVGLVGTDATPVTGVKVDNVAPTVSSASAKSATTVDIVFSEAIAAGSVPSNGAGFTIAGLTVSAATLQSANTVRLTTSSQTPSASYPVSVAASTVTDIAGNGNAAGSAAFTGYVVDTQAPTVPTGLTATAGGASPTIASLSWTASTDNVGVTGYRIYRAVSATGTFTSIGTSASTSFNDTNGVPGQDYWYKVSAYDAAGNESGLSASAGPVVSTWTLLPHAVYSSATTYCGLCHESHQAVTARYLIRDAGAGRSEVAVCYVCHDGSGAIANVKTGTYNSFALASGHYLEDVDTATDLTNTCSACHNPHKVPTLGNPVPQSVINGATVTGANNTWCFACHNTTSDWYTKTTPAKTYPSTATRDASGYTFLGTFPGPTAYEATTNPHYTVTASSHYFRGSTTADWVVREQRDCLYCHEAHRGTQTGTQDGLIAQFSASNFTLCFQCHGTASGGQLTPSQLAAAGAVNIQQFYPTTAGGTATQSGTFPAGTRYGHRVRSNVAGATLSQDEAVPCYDCHNPHGSSAARYGLLVIAATGYSGGATTYTVVGDGAGELDVSTAAGVRNFCFTCHTTSDTSAGWNGSVMALVPANAAFEGIARSNASYRLRLPAANGHAAADTQSCNVCHGSSYAAGGSNVHNPTGGVSNGGQTCYACHPAYKDPMERTGATRTTYYHHVLGTAVMSGDIAPNTGAYPTSSTDVYCVSCHTDHNYFNANKGANLRSSITAAGSSVMSTDYNATTNAGICTSCHAASLTKEVTGLQKNDTSTATPKIVTGDYSSSAHYYGVSSSFISSPFSANCSKCHNDEQSKEYQTSTYKFGTHYSSARRVISAFGAAVTDPIGEDRCYKCHSGATAGTDYYGTEPMSIGAHYTQAQFSLSSRHPVASGDQGTGDAVECESCHNPHVVDRASSGSPVTDPDNGYNTIAYATDANIATFCLKCHDGALPAYTVNGATYIPYTVTQANTALNNKSTYGARGHWNLAGSTVGGANAAAVTAPVSCAECHDNHGSAAPKLLGAFDTTDKRNEINADAITANNNTVCFACHEYADSAWSTFTLDATGYPVTGTWPGKTVYEDATASGTKEKGIHRADGNAADGSVVWPGSAYADGMCLNCHDVHGTANTYDELRGTYNSTDFTLCFTCHDAAPGFDIKQYYPTSAGGSATQNAFSVPLTSRYGHRTKSVGTLPAGSALPCYYCHQPHGSGGYFGLMVRSEIVAGTPLILGDGSLEIGIDQVTGESANLVRRFCFACHTTSGITNGNADTTSYAWNGGANATESNNYTATTNGTIAGISRTSNAGNAVLKLPRVSGHYRDDTQSCYQCHGNSYAAGGSNVHNPTGGVSAGGVSCYACHSAYKDPMERTGATRTTYYHHVLGTAVMSGDIAPNTGAYPTSSTDVYCVSCHTDHNYFNANKGANLRSSITAAGSSVMSTDFSSSSNNGVCTSCHVAALTKESGFQKNDGTTTTPTIATADYGASAHDYYATSTFGTGNTFYANCSKCHNDEQTKEYQTSTNKFGTHYSSTRRVLAAMGITVADPLAEESECYKCHSLTASGAKTATNNNDWYGTITNMTAASQAVQGLMGSTYRHNVAGYIGVHRPSPTDETRTYISANKHVECADCHDVHAATTTRHTAMAGYQSATGYAVSGALASVPGASATFSATNWTAPTAYASVSAATYEYQICFKCHSGYNTNVTTWGGTGAAAWTDQGLEFSTANNAYHPVVAAVPVGRQLTAGEMRAAGTAGGQAVGGWAPGDTMYCSDCHAQSSTGSLGPHGSAVKWMLKGPNQAWPYTTAAANGTSTGTYRTLDAWTTNDGTADGLFCYNCHNRGSGTGNHFACTYSHGTYACMSCHIRVPHGGKVSGLLCAVDLAGTSSGNMPARYAADGNGTMLSNHMRRVSKPWGEANCVDNCNHNGTGAETW